MCNLCGDISDSVVFNDKIIALNEIFLASFVMTSRKVTSSGLLCSDGQKISETEMVIQSEMEKIFKKGHQKAITVWKPTTSRDRLRDVLKKKMNEPVKEQEFISIFPQQHRRIQSKKSKNFIRGAGFPFAQNCR